MKESAVPPNRRDMLLKPTFLTIATRDARAAFTRVVSRMFRRRSLNVRRRLIPQG